MKAMIRIGLPLLVIVAGLFAAWRINAARPVAPRRPPTPSFVTIDVEPLKRTDYQIILHSRGTVHAPTRTQLAAEVTGRVIEVAESLRDGSFFAAGDVLVRLDPRDYEFEVHRLEQELKQARANLTELDAEVAGNERQIKLAKRLAALQRTNLDREEDLARRGFSSKATRDAVERTELTAQTQVEEIRIKNDLLITRRTRLLSAIALASIRLRQAQVNLERTRIEAPYNGRVRQRSVDIADFVNKGAAVASIYAVDRAEVRLPLSDSQLAFIDLPRRYRNGADAPLQTPVVHLLARNGSTTHRWRGKIVRSEGAIDTSNRQLFVIGEVEDPYGHFQDGRPPLRVGTFVQAQIEGRRLTDVYTVLHAYVKGENQLLLVSADRRRMHRHAVDVVWRDESVVVFRSDIPEGQLICTTPVVFAGDTVDIRIRDDDRGRDSGRKSSGNRPQGRGQKAPGAER